MIDWWRLVEKGLRMKVGMRMKAQLRVCSGRWLGRRWWQLKEEGREREHFILRLACSVVYLLLLLLEGWLRHFYNRRLVKVGNKVLLLDVDRMLHVGLWVGESYEGEGSVGDNICVEDSITPKKYIYKDRAGLVLYLWRLRFAFGSSLQPIIYLRVADLADPRPLYRVLGDAAQRPTPNRSHDLYRIGRAAAVH